METKGVVIWIGFLLLCAVILFITRRIKKRIEKSGIETTGVISLQMTLAARRENAAA